MVMEERDFEEQPCLRPDRRRAGVLADPAPTPVATPAPPAAPPTEKIPLFWQIFGGTIFGVLALIVITAYSQLSNTATDLRRDVNQVQTEQVRKDELNVRLTALWNRVKELQATTASRASLEESTKVLNNDLGVRMKTDDDQRKDLQRQLEELSRRVQTLAERLAVLEATYRLTQMNGGIGK